MDKAKTEYLLTKHPHKLRNQNGGRIMMFELILGDFQMVIRWQFRHKPDVSKEQIEPWCKRPKAFGNKADSFIYSIFLRHLIHPPLCQFLLLYLPQFLRIGQFSSNRHVCLSVTPSVYSKRSQSIFHLYLNLFMPIYLRIYLRLFIIFISSVPIKIKLFLFYSIFRSVAESLPRNDSLTMQFSREREN